MNCEKATNLVSWCVFGGTVALALATFITLSMGQSHAGILWANQDVAQTLYVGRAVLSGTRLYIDLLETNPPGIFLLAGAIARLGEYVHCSSIHLYHAGVLLLGTLGAWNIRRATLRLGHPAAAVLVGSAYVLILVLDIPRTEFAFTSAFGQREHLFAVAFTAYLMWRLLDKSGVPTARILLVCVGYLSSLKPQFAVLVLCLEFLCWFEERNVRISTWSILGVTGILPYAILSLLAPTSFLAFLRVCIPYQWNGTYAALNRSYSFFVRTPEHHWIVVLLALIGYCLWPLWRNAALNRCVKRTAIALPLLAYAMVLQQGKYWDYHSVVVVSVSLILAALLLSIYLTEIPAVRAQALLALGAIILSVQIAAAQTSRATLMTDWRQGLGYFARPLKIAPILDGRKRVLYFSTSIGHLHLVNGLHQTMLGRYSYNFDYPSIVRDPEPSRRARRLLDYCKQQRLVISEQQPDAIVFIATGQALTSPTEELHPLLVEQCHVIPEGLYRRVDLAELPEVKLYLRDPRTKPTS